MWRRALRTQCNRVLVVALLVVALPSISIANRLWSGTGPRLVRVWVRWGARLTGVRFEQCGAGGVDPSGVDPSGVDPSGVDPSGLRVLVANHSSVLDIAAIVATHPTARFVAGADLFKIPLLAGAMRAVGTVPVDRSSGSGKLSLAGQVAEGCLTVFAEGAIAAPGSRLPFHRGAFALAIEMGADVVPVAIRHSASCLPPKSAMGVRPGTVEVEYLPSIRTGDLTFADRYRLCEQVEHAILSALGADDGGIG